MSRPEPQRRSGYRPGRVGLTVCGLIAALAANLSSIGAETPPIQPVAEVHGEAITAEELERALGARLRQLEEQIHDLKRKQLDALIAERLLVQEALKRGGSVTALLDAEVTARVGLVTEQEVQAIYQANKTRLRGEE